ncbi:chymotrypsin-1-like [Phymastichus coffea]|uniref:chymotrypsin-1-like n=1 Tax=Phymastichus coffea TaxID=108790 RepID=UPI00273B56ED|nr:chymotrypsin-1-like [Phymastichus coffea]
MDLDYIITDKADTCESYTVVSLKQRMIDGKRAQIKNYPYQVSIQELNQHLCGGTIISERHILTAAHCIINVMTPPYTFFNVVMGTSFTDRGGEVHNITTVDVHPDWIASEKNSYQNDLAIITLTSKIVFNKYKQKAMLPNKDVEDGKEANFTGWGLIRQTPDIYPKQLHRIRTILITNEKCHQKLGKAVDIVIHKTQVCAYSAPGIGACIGDSGGPLVIDGEIVGISSWTKAGRCAAGSPDVYTNVYAFKDFIKSVLNRQLIDS